MKPGLVLFVLLLGSHAAAQSPAPFDVTQALQNVRAGTDAENDADPCAARFGLRRRLEAAANCHRAPQANPEYARPEDLLRRIERR